MYKKVVKLVKANLKEPLLVEAEAEPSAKSPKERPSLARLATSTLIFSFKIDGMTCVACSRIIESAMQREYEDQGLILVQIALLTHKMRIEFTQVGYQKY